MKNIIFLLLVIAIACIACGTTNNINKVADKISLNPYAGSQSFQVSLIDKVEVEFDSSFYLPDTRETLEDFAATLLLYSEWEREHLHYLHLNKDSSIIAANMLNHLLSTLSQSRIHSKIDSLNVYITDMELIVPYFRKGSFVTIPALSGVRTEKAIGPSRVTLQLFYQCYHNGYVTENFKLLHRTISANQASNTRGGGAYLIENHFQEAYTVVNELIEKASVVIRSELEEEIRRY